MTIGSSHQSDLSMKSDNLLKTSTEGKGVWIRDETGNRGCQMIQIRETLVMFPKPENKKKINQLHQVN